MKVDSSPSTYFADYFAELGRRLGDAGAQSLEALCGVLVGARSRRGKVILLGNGASSAIASHVAVDLTKVAGIRAVTMNDVDLITCFGNDYGYENWMAKAVEFYADGNDVVILISSSGRSPNVVNAARRARDAGVEVVTLTGFDADNPLRALGTLNLWVDSRSYNVVETTHQSWLLAALDRIAAGENVPPAGYLSTPGRTRPEQKS